MPADPNALIAVTGRAYFGSAGATLEEAWTACLEARAGGEWMEFQAGRRACRAAVLRASDPAKTARRLDRSVAVGLDAARAAGADAGGVSIGAVFAGTSRGPVQTLARSLDERRFPPGDGPAGVVGCLSGAIAAELGIVGAAVTLSASCTSSAAAIALAAQHILAGGADVALVGGAEAPLHPAALGPLATAGILGTADDPARACRPFDRTRDGTAIGEGAAFLVLERLSSARARRATVHALLAGWALGSAPATRTGQEESGMTGARVLREALARGGLGPEAVGYVHLHGTGTPLNDRAEAAALASVFERPVLCSSTKAVTGHCMGAASAMEAALTLRALDSGMVPPSANCFERDPVAPPGLVTDAPRGLETPVAAVLSSGFWGTHAALVFVKA